MKYNMSRDVVAGSVLLVFGLSCAIYAQRYDFGSASRMGPGYFPTVIGILIVCIGVAMLLVALRVPGPALPKIEWANLGFALASVLVFVLTVRTIGVVPATILTVILCSVPDRTTSWKRRIILALAISGVAAVVFKYLFGVQVPYF